VKKVAEEKKKKRLNVAQKRFVVRCLAQFMSPTEVADLVEEDLGVEMSRQAVEAYDPTKFMGQKLGDELKKLFWEERKKFVDDESNIDVAHRSFRLRELGKLYRAALKDGKDVIAAQHLEQAAKERGGLFTNTRKLKVDDKRKTLADILGVKPEEIPDRVN
jgi:hypothetical protein